MTRPADGANEQRQEADVVVVGGGIAGGALATVLARRGLRVTLLERQREYHDRVRGEYMVPWGAAEAQQLGLLETFHEAGGFFIERQIGYDEVRTPAMAEAAPLPLGAFVPGVPGSLCVGHPEACAALSAAAEAAGATVLRGVEGVRITTGAAPAVAFQHDGSERTITCRLIAGADGRTSTVRGQAGIPMQSETPTHTVAGLLVDGVPGWPQGVAASGTEADVMYFIFPQGGERLRLYACTTLEQRERFAGAGGAAQMIETFQALSCFPRQGIFDAALPIGPCATLTGEDSWTEQPFTDGVVLVGDAAGYNDPIIGQGLSIALRDVRLLSELLLAGPDWSPRALEPYAEERRERMRRLRFAAALLASLNTEFGPEAAARRVSFYQRAGEDPGLRAPLGAAMMGPEKLPEEVFSEAMRERVLGEATAAGV